MQSLNSLKNHRIEVVFTDIDGTLTEKGRLKSTAYESLWKLFEAGFKVIPVTGRPAGWCEMIARFWPVEAVIGENGGFYFQYKNQKMRRHFEQDEGERTLNRSRLQKIETQILQEVPEAALASDQFCRIFDLAIDFCEDIPALKPEQVLRIKKIFEEHGAQAKISSIHVNGWFGSFDKGSTCRKFIEQEWSWTEEDLRTRCAFVGDSPNDEPLFQLFPFSFGVANVEEFKTQMKHLPRYIASKEEGAGFTEIAEKLIQTRSR